MCPLWNLSAEIGLVMGFNKLIILTLNENQTSQKDIPFDINPFMNIPYNSNEDLKKKMEDHLDELIVYLDLNR